jgi:choline dehydrogenase-like flavoprotein
MFWTTLFFVFSAITQVVRATCVPKSFDYVIVGGGPAGLLIANRLSANPNTTVAVIEAGDSGHNNPNISYVPKSIMEYGIFMGTSIDWKYKTAPQKYAGNSTLSYWAGKALGGSTAVNGMTYIRAEKDQIDDWEELGNEGLNWESMLEYFLAQEGFHVPNAEMRSRGAVYEDDAHGMDGEIAVSFSPYLVGQGFAELLKETSEAMGYPYNEEPNNGTMRGFNTWPMTINASALVRADAARTFYFPIAESRPNLHVFFNTTAARITWDQSHPTPEVLANGVEVITSDNVTETISATKEVIVAGGAIRSPGFLEHSGVGNPAVLEPLGIDTVNPLYTVGANLPDQPQNGFVYNSSTNWTGYPTFISYLSASDLFGEELPAFTEEVRANLSAYAATIIADYAPNTTFLAIQEDLLKRQFDLVFTPNSAVPLMEILWAPVGTQIVARYWNLLPFSRGSIHINSTDATIPPNIDPNFLQLPIDTYVQAAAAVRIREHFTTSPLAEHVTGEVTPGFDTVPQGAGWRDPLWDSWIRETLAGNSHPVSTCAMMSAELGGVVDSQGRVYGTSNVRVVDASVFPTQISGHLSANIYAIAGRIADVMVRG